MYHLKWNVAQLIPTGFLRNNNKEKFYYKKRCIFFWLMPNEAFNNPLTIIECFDENYLQAKIVWELFNCKNYLKVYLVTDAFLLTDIFENFKS